MNILGWFLAVLGLGGLVFGILQMLKMKKMNRVPHRRPSEIAQLGPRAGDANGLLSTEGQAQPGQQQLFGPMSGEPCLAYEITIEAKWEKHTSSENGTQKTTGSNKVFTQAEGCLFQIVDGGGRVIVDSTGALDASMEKSHSSEVGVGGLLWPSTLNFGRMNTNTPIVSNDDSRVIGFVGTEKIVRPSPTIYALGQIGMGAHGPTLHTPKGIGSGKLILSSKGRTRLLASTKRNMILGYALGGAFALGGTGAGLFAPKTAIDVSGCPTVIAESAVDCDDRLDSRLGKTYTWTVHEAGYFNVKVTAPDVKYPIKTVLRIKTAAGREVAVEYSDGTADTVLSQKLDAGDYVLVVTDAWERKVGGGMSFHLSVARDTSMSDGAKDASVAIAEPDESDESDEPAPSPVAAAKAAIKAPSAPEERHGSKPKAKALALTHAHVDAGAAPPKTAPPAPPPAAPPPPAKAEPAPPPKAAPAPPPPAPAKPPPPEKKGVSLEVHFP